MAEASLQLGHQDQDEIFAIRPGDDLDTDWQAGAPLVHLPSGLVDLVSASRPTFLFV